MQNGCFYVLLKGGVNLIESPLNYTGGKYKLLPQLLPLFPKSINRMIDIFCGGCNVGINVEAESIIFNDINSTVINLFKVLKKNELDYTLKKVEFIINKYKLSMSSKNGYEFYGCESAAGLGEYNKSRYLGLREDFNNRKRKDDTYFYMFYVLLIYSFNNQIRFNSKGEFNLPVGKRDFNSKMRSKLISFVNRLKYINCVFSNESFVDIDISEMGKDDFIYADPPYLITCATYNENAGWSIEKEKQLLNFLDLANENNIKFALSNVLSSKGKTNHTLVEWLEKNQRKYKIIRLNYNYSNSNYQTKDRTAKADEVLIINYWE